jgi:hypothetical protein
MLFPALGEHELLVGLQHRECPDLLEVAVKTAFSGSYDRQTG